MELTEPIESINKQLIDLFGIDTITGLAMWRVVWSNDQREKRYGTYDDFTPGGLYIRTVTEVREVQKYPWIRERFILERLCVVPEVNANDLPTSKLSYEVMWVFENDRREYLPPRVDACKFVIDTVLAAMGKSDLVKYKESEKTEEERIEAVNKLQEELFGNETEIGDALAHKYGVGYTGPSKMIH